MDAELKDLKQTMENALKHKENYDKADMEVFEDVVKYLELWEE